MALGGITLPVFAICLLPLADRTSHSTIKAQPLTHLYRIGRVQAKRDLAKGKLMIRIFGYPLPWHGDFSNILEKEYAVKLVGVAGCVVSKRIRETTRGYNEVMEAAIDKRYGKGTLDKVYKRAEKAYFEYVEFLSNPPTMPPDKPPWESSQKPPSE